MGEEKRRNSERLAALVDRYRVIDPCDFDLDRFASDDLPDDAPRKSDAKHLLAAGVQRLSDLQEHLYADARWSLLLVFQAMDAGGKDSTIKHVLSGINPQGVAVTSFKAPNDVDLAHDFLWRVHRVAPARGMIGVFNRSHYEEVLVTRVHENLLDGAHLPPELRTNASFWDHRITDIAAFEAYLARQGTRILKFFLNVGRDKQKERFLERLDQPAKRWKFDAADLREREAWPRYRAAYQAAIAGTARPNAPWFVVPADRKWFMQLIVAEAIIEALEALSLEPPPLSSEQAGEWEDARQRLKDSP